MAFKVEKTIRQELAEQKRRIKTRLKSARREGIKHPPRSEPIDCELSQLVVSLANTQEALFIKNRAGNRPSYEGAHVYLDKAVDLCRRAGFERILLQGDTDFSQTQHLDRWDDDARKCLLNSSSYNQKLGIETELRARKEGGVSFG